MNSPIERLLLGFLAPIRGLQLIIASPQLILLSVIPIVIGIGIVSLGLYVMSEALGPYIDPFFEMQKVADKSQALADILATALKVIYWALITVFNFLVGYLCVLVVGGPFYALLVEAVFKQKRPGQERSGSLGLFFKMMFVGIIKVSIFTTVGLFCFVLAFVPGLNWLSPVIIFAMVAFDCMDYAFEADYLSWRSRIRFFYSHGLEFVGLALAIFATTLVPGSFFLLLPAFICGAAKIYIQLAPEPV